MTPIEVILWALAALIVVAVLVLSIALLASLARSLRKPRDKSTDVIGPRR